MPPVATPRRIWQRSRARAAVGARASLLALLGLVGVRRLFGGFWSQTAAAGVVRIPPVRRVVVVGATHGNEVTGAWVVKKLAPEHGGLGSRPSFGQAEAILGNPRGYQENRRFIDADLNRQFSDKLLGDMALSSYEAQRAKALNAHLGPKWSDSAADFVVDLHTSTAAMGINFIVEPSAPLGVAAACWCQRELRPRTASGELPEVHITHETLGKSDSPHVISVARDGLMIEVGPVPQGLLRADVCHWMETALGAVFDFLDAFNSGQPLELPARVVAFRDLQAKIPVPMGEDGKPEALFHPNFQGRDFKPLSKGDPIFQLQSGEVLVYDGAFGDTVWPVFINEAAYYLPESGLGFGVTVQDEVDVPQVLCVPRVRG